MSFAQLSFCSALVIFVGNLVFVGSGCSGAIAPAANPSALQQAPDAGEDQKTCVHKHAHTDHKHCCKCCHHQMKGVEKSIAKIDNGIVVTMTTKCPKTQKRVQEQAQQWDPASCCAQCKNAGQPPKGDVTKTVENLEHGIKITFSSNNPVTVTKLHAHALEQQHMDCSCPHKKKAKGPLWDAVVPN